MATQIELLASLQLVDRSLREKERMIEESQARVAELEENGRQRGSELTAAREALGALLARQSELESRLTANEAKLKDRRMRVTRIRNEKELGLAKREVDLLRDENTTIEAELVGVMEEAERASTRAAELETAVAEIARALETEAAELRSRIAALGGDITAERERRATLVHTVEDDLRRRYEMICERRGGIAVVEIRSGICQGCHMNIPPQLFNQIQRNEQVFLCPNCQRMLYWRPEGQENATE